jgi:hypothetical protein
MSRSYQAQNREMRWMAIVHNIMIVLWERFSTEQAESLSLLRLIKITTKTTNSIAHVFSTTGGASRHLLVLDLADHGIGGHGRQLR